MNEQYKSLVNWYYIEDWSDYPGPKGRVVPNAEGYDNPSDYDGTELYISQGTTGDKEGNLFIDEEGNDVPFNSQYFEKTNLLKENKMNKEQLRMQMLAGIITEGQYVAKLNEEQALGTLFAPEEDEDGMIEYYWNNDKVIDIIKNMGYDDPEEIAKEITTISSPYDFLEMMRNKIGDEDLDITDITLDMFMQSIEKEFEK